MVGLAHLGQGGAITRKCVHDGKLAVRIREQMLVVLRGDVDQLANAGGQVRGAGQATAQVDAAPARPCDRTSDHEPVLHATPFGQQALAHLPSGRQLEHGLHPRLLAPRTNHLGTGPASAQQAQRLDQDALSGPRLAGYNGQARS